MPRKEGNADKSRDINEVIPQNIFSPHAPRTLPMSKTEILETESEYPYCALPPHFFERRLLAMSKGLKEKDGVVLEILRG